MEHTLTDLNASTMKAATQGGITCAFGGCAQRFAVPVHCFVSRVTSGTRWFFWATATRLYRFLVVLYADTGAEQALANLVNVTEAE